MLDYENNVIEDRQDREGKFDRIKRTITDNWASISDGFNYQLQKRESTATKIEQNIADAPSGS